jgi:hypothetical protein
MVMELSAAWTGPAHNITITPIAANVRRIETSLHLSEADLRAIAEPDQQPCCN